MVACGVHFLVRFTPNQQFIDLTLVDCGRHLQLLSPHMDAMQPGLKGLFFLNLAAIPFQNLVPLRRSIAMFADCGKDFLEMLNSFLVE